MKQLMKEFWVDEAGLVLSAELVFVASIAGIGMIVGLSAARDGVTSELADVGSAIQSYNQGYSVLGIQGHGAGVNGSRFQDNTDYCDTGAVDTAAADESCIVRLTAAAADETNTAMPGSLIQ